MSRERPRRPPTDDPADTSLRDGLAEGWRAARPYLLSHHGPAEWDRCYPVNVRGRRVRLCARCTGIYPGIAAGIALYALGLPSAFSTAVVLGLVATLPAPALLDWAASAHLDRQGSNPVRTATGALLGVGYGLGLGLLFGSGELAVLAVGAGYGLLAVAGLARTGESP